MKIVNNKSVATVLTLVVLTHSLADDEVDSKFNREFEKRSALVSSELENIGNHAFAGKYYHGDGMGVNMSLRIAPKSGAVYSWRCCVGTVAENFGDVTIKDDVLKIKWLGPIVNDRNPEGEFLLIRWGERTYLVPPEDIIDFCTEVRRKREPRDSHWGRFYLRDGDDKKQPGNAKPVLPKGFERYLTMKHLHTTLKSVGLPKSKPTEHRENWDEVNAKVVLPIGEKDGVLPRMCFYVKPLKCVENESFSIVIDKVHAQEADGTITYYQDPRSPLKTPTTTWQVTTDLISTTSLAKYFKDE